MLHGRYLRVYNWLTLLRASPILRRELVVSDAGEQVVFRKCTVPKQPERSLSTHVRPDGRRVWEGPATSRPDSFPGRLVSECLIRQMPRRRRKQSFAFGVQSV